MTLKLNRVSNETTADRNNKNYFISLLLSSVIHFDCPYLSIDYNFREVLRTIGKFIAIDLFIMK